LGTIAISSNTLGRLLNARLIGAPKVVSLPQIGAARIVVLQVKTRVTLGGVTTNRVIDSRTSLGQYTGTIVLVKGIAFNYVSGSVEQKKALSAEYESVAAGVISTKRVLVSTVEGEPVARICGRGVAVELVAGRAQAWVTCPERGIDIEPKLIPGARDTHNG
jgi:hypothetical protein